jgi:hypothetical protein
MEIKAQADYSLAAILTDNRFYERVEITKDNFDKGIGSKVWLLNI